MSINKYFEKTIFGIMLKMFKQKKYLNFLLTILQIAIIYFLFLIIWRTAEQIIEIIPLFTKVLTEAVQDMSPEMTLIIISLGLFLNFWMLSIAVGALIKINNWFEKTINKK